EKLKALLLLLRQFNTRDVLEAPVSLLWDDSKRSKRAGCVLSIVLWYPGLMLRVTLSRSHPDEQIGSPRHRRLQPNWVLEGFPTALGSYLPQAIEWIG